MGDDVMNQSSSHFTGRLLHRSSTLNSTWRDVVDLK